jgi:hypothetical protein
MSWQQFIDDLGAQRNANQEVSHFTNNEAASLIIGDHLAVINVQGPDSEKFLQGQLTCDLREVSAGQWRLAMHLDLKGRGQHSYVVLPQGSGFSLLTCRQRADEALAALKKYAMFSKATLTLEAEQVAMLLSGPINTEALAAADISATAPSEAGQCQQGTGYCLARVSQQTVLLLSEQAVARKLLQHYPLAELGGSTHWLRHDIEAGIGHVFPGGQGLWLPQALNYDLLQGVHFNKGCYLGQEVVARMHFKGKMKQRMQHLRWQAGVDAEAGAQLRNDKGGIAGELVCAIASATHTEALVVLRLDHEGPLSINEQSLEWHNIALPYSLPEA